MSKGIVWMVGLMALVVLAAGCGGGDETTSLTRSEFLKQGNALCEAQEERRSNIIRKAIEGQDQQKLLPMARREEVVVETVVPYEVMAEELNALGAPEGDEEQIEAIVKAIEESAKDIRNDPATALTTTSQFDGANKLANEYGLSNCAI